MKPVTRTLSIAAVMVLVTVTTTEATQNQATFSGLGHLPDGQESEAHAVSADGRVVVGSGDSTSGPEAFRWEDGVMTGLGDLPGGAFSSVAAAVSADGRVVVGRSEGESGLEAFRWENGSMIGLGDLPGGDFISRANAVSADGSVIVGAAGSAAGFEAFRWEGGSMQPLGDLPGGLFKSQAMGVSGDGQVIVGYSDSGDLEATRWVDGAIEALGFLAPPEPGAVFQSLAWAVSADGSAIVGGSDNYRIVFDPYTGQYVTAQYDEPFRLKGNVMTSLFDGISPGNPPGQPWTFGIPLAADADGSVVVGWGFGAFIWDALNGMRDLQDQLESDYGLDLGGWRLDRATGVSADGAVIVGYGRNPAGKREAWIAVLPQPDLLALIDVKPGSDANVVNPSARGMLRIAILGSDDFDVADVDVTTLTAGPGNATPVPQRAREARDVNGDGFADLISHYRIEELGITAGDTQLCVLGATLDGTTFGACDSVATTPR